MNTIRPGYTSFVGPHPLPIRHGMTVAELALMFRAECPIDIELEVIPAAEHYGLGILPWSPLHGGLLGGVLRKDRDHSVRYVRLRKL